MEGVLMERLDDEDADLRGNLGPIRVLTRPSTGSEPVALRRRERVRSALPGLGSAAVAAPGGWMALAVVAASLAGRGLVSGLPAGRPVPG
jgi:anti-sigma factor RsiW